MCFLESKYTIQQQQFSDFVIHCKLSVYEHTICKQAVFTRASLGGCTVGVVFPPVKVRVRLCFLPLFVIRDSYSDNSGGCIASIITAQFPRLAVFTGTDGSVAQTLRSCGRISKNDIKSSNS